MCLAIVAMFGAAIYVNSLGGKPIWDDNSYIIENAFIKNPSLFYRLFTTDSLAGAGKKGNFYRPIQMLTHAADHSAWRLNLAGHHATNILLHIAAALCVFWLIERLFRDRLLSFLTSILFVIHPVHTEAVAYISGRADPLVLIFLLLALIYYDKGSLLAPVFFFAMALLSKESGLIFPALLLAYHIALRKKPSMRQVAPIVATLAMYVALRLTLLDFPNPAHGIYPPVLARLPGAFAAILTYARLLILPIDLHMEYGMPAFRIADASVLLGVALSALAIMGIYRRRNDRIILFGSLFFLISLAPVLNIFRVNAYMAEHWLYVPSVGFFLIAAYGLRSLIATGRLKIAAVIGTVLLVAAYSIATVRQNSYWRDPVSFYERTILFAPFSARAYNSLGNEYLDMGDPGKALACYKKAIELDPADAGTYNNIGLVLAGSGNFREAIVNYRKAISLDPAYADAYSNMGISYFNMGDKDTALSSFEKAVSLSPSSSGAYNNLGVFFNFTGRFREAEAAFMKALALDPDDPNISVNLKNARTNILRNAQ